MKIKYVNKSGKREIRTCENCTCNFETLSIKVRGGGEKFCSAECYQLKRKEGLSSKKERSVLHQKKYKYGLTKEDFERLLKRKG